jgi:hypothetical protein
VPAQASSTGRGRTGAKAGSPSPRGLTLLPESGDAGAPEANGVACRAAQRRQRPSRPKVMIVLTRS